MEMGLTMSEHVVRLGAIGTGGIWGAHRKNLAALGGNEIVAVCDVSDANREKAAAATGARAYVDTAEMFAQETLDGVIICTPASVRLPLVELATQHGVPVLAEKPPAATLQDAAAMASLSENAGVPVAIGFMYRYLPAVARLRELIQDRPVNLVQSTFFCPAATEWPLPGWFYIKERSGGHVLDQAIHMVDLIRYLVGDITQVHTLGNNLLCPKSDTFTIEDSSSSTFRFASGASGTHIHSWAHNQFRGDVTLIGKDYALTLELDSHLHGYIGDETIDETFPAPPEGCSHHYEEMRCFLEALRSRDFSTLLSPIADAKQSLATVLAMNESIDSGAPVDVC
jgi:predicted dehydrogenase